MSAPEKAPKTAEQSGLFMRRSIRQQLLIWQIGALLVTGILISVITYGIAWNGFNRVRDYTLEQVAHAIVRHGIEPAEEEDEWKDAGRFLSQIWETHKQQKRPQLVYTSRPSLDIPPQAPGWHTITLDNEEWRTYTLSHANLTIQIASRQANRNLRFAEMMPWLLLPLALLIAVLGALIWFAAVRALSPLERARQEIVHRDVSTLHPLPVANMPEEIKPMILAINGLLERLERALALQRSFIADAAHELRSPLTAIRLQAQLAERSSSDSERAETLAQLQVGIERAAHMVSQLLNLARIEPDATPTEHAPVALDMLLKEVINSLSLIADSRHIDLGLVECKSIALSGPRENLRILLGNLIDNALRYTPTGGRVDVSLTRLGEHAVFRVADSGPGIPVAERSRVFRRFYRLAGQDTPGSGLGLAIVAGIVHGLHGSVTLGDSELGGLLVEIRLPLS